MLLNRLRPVLLACTALGVIHSVSSAVAQEASGQGEAGAQATQLETIVVKGKRMPAGSVGDTPLATETTAAEIEKKQITSIEGLGNTTEPGVSTGFAGAGVNIR